MADDQEALREAVADDQELVEDRYIFSQKQSAELSRLPRQDEPEEPEATVSVQRTEPEEAEADDREESLSSYIPLSPEVSQ